jgi:hypothetical protein
LARCLLWNERATACSFCFKLVLIDEAEIQ